MLGLTEKPVNKLSCEERCKSIMSEALFQCLATGNGIPERRLRSIMVKVLKESIATVNEMGAESDE